MSYLENTPGRACIVDGKEFLFFSGYSYLGMNHVKAFTNFVKDGIDKYGVLFPSSRISNTQLKLYDTFEKKLSEITGLEETVTFSSGLLAGKTMSDILSSYKNILVAPQTHPAIKVESTVKHQPESFYDWQSGVSTLINSSGENDFALIADSVNILNPVVNDFSFLENIHTSKKITVLIDDSHGIGVLGKKGQGIISLLPKKENLDYIICYSLSKAFNIEGGAVSCSKGCAEKLRQHPNYTASTPINPSLIYAFMNCKKLYAIQREKLFTNIQYFKSHLPSSVLSHDFDLPIFILKDEVDVDHLHKKGLIISSFGYPDPSSKKINRIIINALHKKKDLQKLIECLNKTH